MSKRTQVLLLVGVVVSAAIFIYFTTGVTRCTCGDMVTNNEIWELYKHNRHEIDPIWASGPESRTLREAVIIWNKKRCPIHRK